MPIVKLPTFVVRNEDPLCGGPSLATLVERAETPPDALFVRNHGPVPTIDPDAFRLVVDGLVPRPLELSLEDLRSRFPRHEALVTIQCAGNRRDELMAVRPIPGEVPWGADAIGTARWSGFSLVDVLVSAGLGTVGADLHVAFEALDHVERDGRTFGFGASIALGRALAGDVLLADRLGDRPMPPEHGAPLRVVVPGFIGARSVKWLGRISVREQPSDNHFQARAYKVLPADADPHDVDWSPYPPIEEAPLHAVIAAPGAGAVVPSGRLDVVGYATGRGLYAVTAVEVALGHDRDAGQLAPWVRAELLDEPAPGRWVRWRARLDVPAGPLAIVARAHDASGVEQPEDPATRWNPKGYSNDAWHRVTVIAD